MWDSLKEDNGRHNRKEGLQLWITSRGVTRQTLGANPDIHYLNNTSENVVREMTEQNSEVFLGKDTRAKTEKSNKRNGRIVPRRTGSPIRKNRKQCIDLRVPDKKRGKPK